MLCTVILAKIQEGFVNNMGRQFEILKFPKLRLVCWVFHEHMTMVQFGSLKTFKAPSILSMSIFLDFSRILEILIYILVIFSRFFKNSGDFGRLSILSM